MKSGVGKIIRGAMKYSETFNKTNRDQFHELRKKYNKSTFTNREAELLPSTPVASFYTCVDSRMLPSKFTNTSTGDMFIVRNPGNLVPNSENVTSNFPSAEAAVLELCLSGANPVKDLIVCGHSDCKAMALLYDINTASVGDSAPMMYCMPAGCVAMEVPTDNTGLLASWIGTHCKRSWLAYVMLEKMEFQVPFRIGKGNLAFDAYIDPDKRYSAKDRLSLINTLVQVENAQSYDLVKAPGGPNTHALFLDIELAKFLIFSRKQKQFVVLDDKNFNELITELDEDGRKDPEKEAKMILDEANRKMSNH